MRISDGKRVAFLRLETDAELMIRVKAIGRASCFQMSGETVDQCAGRFDLARKIVEDSK